MILWTNVLGLAAIPAAQLSPTRGNNSGSARVSTAETQQVLKGTTCSIGRKCWYECTGPSVQCGGIFSHGTGHARMPPRSKPPRVALMLQSFPIMSSLPVITCHIYRVLSQKGHRPPAEAKTQGSPNSVSSFKLQEML